MPLQRVHGDCHRGNLLWSSQGVTLVDFDDTAMGPAVQDVWMLVPGRDDEAIVAREVLLQAYERRRPFDRSTLRRGLPTVNGLWTDEMAIIMGDYLYAQSMALLVENGDLVPMEIMAQVVSDMACG